MAHPFMATVADGLQDRGIATLRYQFPYMENGSKRPDRPPLAHATVRAAVDAAVRSCPSLPLFAGGKSFGARMTSQAQADAPLTHVRGLAFLGFPLHPAGKPSDERARHLVDVGIPMLFLQGNHDALADMEILRTVLDRLTTDVTLHVMNMPTIRFMSRSGQARRTNESWTICSTLWRPGSRAKDRSSFSIARRDAMLDPTRHGELLMPRLNFGAFLAPHHPIGEHPMLQFRRDLDLVEHLDKLGYDEFWCGEHHSSGWEMIASPEMFLAAAGERSKRIKLATGVVSLPYHHPFNVAQRMVQLDHMTGGRVIFGSGPGALASDAHTLGVDPMVLRDRQDEAISIIRRLFDGERVTAKCDWFSMKTPRCNCCRCRRKCRSPSPRRSAHRG